MFNHESLSVHFVVELALAAVQEIETIVLDMKANHIATEQSFKHLIGPWKQPEYVPRRKRDVKKESQLDTNAFLDR